MSGLKQPLQGSFGQPHTNGHDGDQAEIAKRDGGTVLDIHIVVSGVFLLQHSEKREGTEDKDQKKQGGMGFEEKKAAQAESHQPQPAADDPGDAAAIEGRHGQHIEEINQKTAGGQGVPEVTLGGPSDSQANRSS